MEDKDLIKKGNQIRRDVMRVSVANGAGHIAPSLSCVDILTALYYKVMRYDFQNPQWEARDRLIFSKAHGCYGLYAILKDLGVIPAHEWEGYYTDESTLAGCMERKLEYGLEAGCGSLGHGLPLAVGAAFATGLQKREEHIFCLCGDGELQEGSAWEALQFAVKHQVSNLTLIIDFNGLQAMDFIENIMDKHADDLKGKLVGFGLEPEFCNGHDTPQLAKILAEARSAKKDLPRVVVARTIKGYGYKCMENIPKFHFRLPTEEELAQGGPDGKL